MLSFIVAMFIVAIRAQDYTEFESEVPNYFRITGGSRSGFRKVPSFVGLKIYYDSGTKQCGGFLGPAADRIVTAARCVFE